ncbi:MAG: fatty acid oxidation complex subunit alpha FadJ [Deltaproteobacteria bacterium]|nr:fatty acid oxidation complex subunit alpha FadJ [Deltaproteobacteria bacterium]
MSDNKNALSFELRADGVGVVWIDVPQEKQNVLYEGFQEEFEAIQRKIEEVSPRALLIASKKDGSFMAGADIKLIKGLTSAAEAERRSRHGQQAMNELEASKRPVVAAIHGACLGGGLELALACHSRVASNDARTQLGVPEVQLGLLPGAGGTQRLPSLIGLEAALDLLLTGKQIEAKKAKKLGLVDEVVPAAILIEAAAKIALTLADEHEKKPSLADRFSEIAAELTDTKALRELALAHNPAGRKLVFDQAEKTLKKKAGPHYPAPYRILEVVKHGLEKGREAGLELEARRFGELAMTDVSRRLVEIFFATTELKKDNGTDRPDVKPLNVQRVGILGAGLMGHGIAFVTLTKAHLPVRLKDRDGAAVGKGLSGVRALLDERVERRRMSEAERDRMMATLTGAVDYSGFKNMDVVIEAVFEDLALKHQVLKDVEAQAKREQIFASNTSSIPIGKIAEASSRPERVVGMHYFSPVHKMPLLEIIRTPKTADEVVATVVDLGKKQGKTVIVVNDGVGFYTSRILGPYMNEASWLLAEGVPIEDIDAAAKAFGFPVGPITLLDEVGIDVAEKVGHIMHSAFGERMNPPPGLEKLVADGRTGRKGQKGFYRYEGKKKTDVDPTIYAVLGIEPKTGMKWNHDEIGERLGLAMVAEAIRCLGEGILRSPRDGDIGAVFGLGFPPFRGGPFRYADSLGPSEMLRRVRALFDKHGKRFAPPEVLIDRARTGNRFYER